MRTAARLVSLPVAVFVPTLLSAVVAATAAPPAGPPRVFWASDPVRPGETVMVHGSDLGDAATPATVEMARFDDGDPAAAPTTPATRPAAPDHWARVPVLQAGDDGRTLKFAVPAAWQPGVFACRVTAGGSASDPVLVNAPDPWWVQGDEGEAASPGGWLRVFGKSLAAGGDAAAAAEALARLEPEAGGEPTPLRPAAGSDDYGLRFDVPPAVPPGKYAVRVHNGRGGPAAWRLAGTVAIAPAPTVPAAVYSVLESYGPDAVKAMRKTLVKYNQPADRTAGILAALKKATDSGGGVVYFPAGRYTIKGPLEVPPRTVLRGEGEGLVTLWWGTGHFNLDGGDARGRERPADDPKAPPVLIHGRDFGLEDLSLYLPIDYQQGIVADDRFRMARVRVRIDHYWLVQGRGGGTVARLGRNFSVTDCDVLAKGDGLVPGRYGVIARNKVAANKSNTPMGSARGVVVEDNQFVSMDPTAYQNIAGTGRDVYYARNRHEALYAHQADYSFTFDAGAGAYLGGLVADGTHLTLAADPVYPKWAPEAGEVWRRTAAVFILDGRGAGQWRDVTANRGRAWEVDRPFDVPPDATSVASIVTFNGRVLVLNNRFEDANWVNAGYGTSVDVACAGNELVRCAELMNHGVLDDPGRHGIEPSWHVQYFDNVIAEGETKVGSFGAGPKTTPFAGPLTRWAVHRRHKMAADNGGSIAVGGNVRDVVVDGCTVRHPAGTINVDGVAQGVLVRGSHFDGGGPAPRYAGDGVRAAVVPGDPARDQP